ncbi:rifin PIR protein, putative [Plasmodium reichenowi]|uniref:Rifin PIR protein, putative n=1 Tax=Plasmodium reichenowi TaxID=5854 RepID=A0A2P9D1C4_PLARE|nr:rifin PIR protein, putative [Plasmodium reichenowi]
MKDHYINILLFALPLNILLTLYHAHNQRNHYTTPSHTHTNRSLCECELYAPVNYDNDPQIKEVMDTFNKQTQQRFHEYDERMKTTRQKCKEQCDKEIQKIILKDKLEKQMAQQLSTLETKIDTDDIPTCVCEKSIADKVEKGCLRCGGVLGGGVMPGMGLIDGSLLGAISVLQPLEIAAAKEAALAEATEAAIEAGMKAVITKIEGLSQSFTKVQGVLDLTPIVTRSTFKNGPALVETAENLFGDACKTLASQKVLLEAEKVGAIEATYGGYHISIIASIVAIVVIVLIMIIIYLVLRYRRKKKMKKKLQYIKLLEE